MALSDVKDDAAPRDLLALIEDEITASICFDNDTTLEVKTP